MANSKALYYSQNFLEWLIPDWFFRLTEGGLLRKKEWLDSEDIRRRVNYYCRLPLGVSVGDSATALGDLKLSRKKTVYYFDSHAVARAFPKNLRWNTLFGDYREPMNVPTIIKSRLLDDPLATLLKLNKVRHFFFVEDDIPFSKKENIAVFRGAANQENRKLFLETHFKNPRCDAGDAHRRKKRESMYSKPFLSVDDQLKNKFILCLEGNDVATNLKWAMSSNSIAIMPRPTCETWFMEGALRPNVHYAEVKADFSDLDEVMDRYTADPDLADAVIENAHKHVAQFRDLKKEKLIGLLVLKKYFHATGQLPLPADEHDFFFA